MTTNSLETYRKMLRDCQIDLKEIERDTDYHIRKLGELVIERNRMKQRIRDYEGLLKDDKGAD